MLDALSVTEIKFDQRSKRRCYRWIKVLPESHDTWAACWRWRRTNTTLDHQGVYAYL